VITAIELAKFAASHGWIVIEKNESEDENFIRYLTPAGQRVLVEFNQDGSVSRVYP
jgi:hypothetical protein